MKRLDTMIPALLFIALVAACSGMESGTATATEPLPNPATLSAPAATPISYAARTDPQGVALVQENETLLAFVDLEGNPLGQRALPTGDMTVDAYHVYGSLSGGLEAIGVIHIQQTSEEMTIMDGRRMIARIDGVLTGYTVLPGQPVVALAIVQDSVGGNVLLQIHLVTTASLPGEAPVLSVEMPYGGALAPLHIAVADGVPRAIWYTRQPQALGGEIFFYPQYDLYQLDLASGEIVQFTEMEEIYQPAISTNGSLLATVDLHLLHVYGFETGEERTFALLPESGNGAGNVIFSPEDETVAWKESSGTNLITMDYAPVIRAATIGSERSHLLSESLFEASCGYAVADLDTVAFVDRERLLVSVMDEYGKYELWMVDLGTDEPGLFLLGEGIFAGFIYP